MSEHLCVVVVCGNDERMLHVYWILLLNEIVVAAAATDLSCLFNYSLGSVVTNKPHKHTAHIIKITRDFPTLGLRMDHTANYTKMVQTHRLAACMHLCDLRQVYFKTSQSVTGQCPFIDTVHIALRPISQLHSSLHISHCHWVCSVLMLMLR